VHPSLRTTENGFIFVFIGDVDGGAHASDENKHAREASRQGHNIIIIIIIIVNITIIIIITITVTILIIITIIITILIVIITIMIILLLRVCCVPFASGLQPMTAACPTPSSAARCM
jgi:uncharacterized membrane protein